MSGHCTVVTGAAGGIGLAVAERALADGRAVVAVDMDGARLDGLFGERRDVLRVSCDLTSADGLKTLADAVKSRFDGVEGFVHAAGFDAMAPLGMVDPDAMHRLFAVHAAFPVQFMGWLARKQNHAPGAACVLVSSLSAHEGAKGHVAYAAAKGAVEGLLRPAAAELAIQGVRLNAVVLGVVETEMSRRWIARLTPDQEAALRGGYPFGLGSAGDVAGAVAFLLSRDARWITGQTLVCDGGHMLK